MAPPRLALNLFWRTFALLALLLAAGVLAWQQTFKALEAEPKALEAAQQLAGLVNLSRVALSSTDAINRVAVVKSLARSEAVQVEVAEATDRWLPYENSPFAQRLRKELVSRLGPQTVLASGLNGVSGLWVRFDVGPDQFWLQTNPAPLQTAFASNWWWIGIALGASLLGAAAIARLINQPLRELSIAASRIRDGEYDSRLDESTLTSEIREVNMGFNRMARELAKMEEDRSVMLAGISHDLRTPLARLRLEAEMSVSDEQARLYIAQDIDQLDAIIAKFMDYARPSELQLQALNLRELIEREAQGFRDPQQIQISVRLSAALRIWTDPTELGRIMLNLFENARRYGHHGDEPARVEVTAEADSAWVLLTVRDHGPGVPQDKLSKLTTPFYRGDTARTAATGAGLGLAIVEKSVQRLGAQLRLANAADSGFVAQLRLKRASV